MRSLPWLLVWAATAAGAFLLGRETAPGPVEPPPTDEPGPPRERGGGPGGPSLSASPLPQRATAARSAERLRAPEVRVVAADAPLTLEGASTPDEVMGRVFAYLSAQLALGPEGHKAAFRTLDGLLGRDGALRPLLSSEEQFAPYLYPWVRFLSDRDAQVADMAETLFRTAAEEPAFFEGTDDDTFELFTEGLGPMLPGMVSTERLERLRGYVQKTLAWLGDQSDKSVRPGRGAPGGEALGKSRNDLERMLRTWTPRLPSKDAAARLKAGAVEPHEVLGLLRQVAPEDRAGLDLAALLGPFVERGELQALRRDVVAGLDGRDRALLDQRLLSSGEGRGVPEWHLVTWLEATGRGSFDAARPFLEQALARGGATADAAALTLLRLSPRPGADAVDVLLRAHPVSPQVAEAVRSAYPKR